MPTQNNTGDTTNPDRNTPEEPMGNAPLVADRDKKRRIERPRDDKKK
jgi:hypothetical protein